MEIVQEIGSYAGLAAVVGLAVLSALYFSQARDVRRLRDWAGRAPERTSEPAAQPSRVVGRPAPKAPGVAGAAPGAVAAAAGATASVANAPPAATPAAARVAGVAENGDEAGDGEPGEGAEGVSQDTMSHPPPAREGEDPDAAAASGELDPQAPGSFADDADYDADSEDPDFDGIHDADDDADDYPDPEDPDLDRADDSEDPDFAADDEDDLAEDSSEQDAVPPTPPFARPRPAFPARPVPPPPRTAQLPPRAAPVTAAGRPSPGAAGGQHGQPGAGTPILPPYERSRPGANPPDRGFFSSPGRGALVIGLGVLVLAAATLGGLELAGGGDDSPQGSADTPGQASSQSGDAADQGTGAGPSIDPSQVTVAVLNGTTVTGLAADVGDAVEAAGYQLGNVTNSVDQERAESVVFYAPGAEAEAKQVGSELKISQREEIDPDTQALAGDASVVVVVGADQS